MKRLLLTLVIVLAFSAGAFARTFVEADFKVAFLTIGIDVTGNPVIRFRFTSQDSGGKVVQDRDISLFEGLTGPQRQQMRDCFILGRQTAKTLEGIP